MKIAVIGSGVSGLGAAYALKGRHEVVLYERERRLGGHAHTMSIDYDGAPIAVDVGFIVYNERNYPNLVGLFEALGVESLPTDMSFAFSGEDLEWCSSFPRGVFAQKRNWANPGFLAMLADIGRFNRIAAADLQAEELENLTLGTYLHRRRFAPAFADRYLLPMGAAIWSSTTGDIARIPARSFIAFFANHGLLQFAPPMWRTVKGGSRAYVERVGAALGERVRLGAGVASVRRRLGRIEVTDIGGHRDVFDQLILACHSDQAGRLLKDADAEERALLAAVPYAPNRVFLHRDPHLMPKRKAAWGSWNYMARDGSRRAGVTYWMNRLQSIELKKPLFVSLNPPSKPDPALTFAEFACDHPQFDAAALAAQARFGRIQGRGGVWYAGAWLGHGFHEDGLTAGLRAALALGGDVPWAFVDHRIPGGALAGPAEALRSAA